MEEGSPSAAAAGDTAPSYSSSSYGTSSIPALVPSVTSSGGIRLSSGMVMRPVSSSPPTGGSAASAGMQPGGAAHSQLQPQSVAAGAAAPALPHPQAALARPVAMELLGKARRGWLLPEEVYRILGNWQTCGIPLTKHVVQRPPHGSLFLYNRNDTKYRYDGVTYRKKANSNSIRENHMRLKVNGQFLVNASYSLCDPDAEGKLFSRRVYWRLDINDPMVLVHYLSTRPIARKRTDTSQGGSARESEDESGGVDGMTPEPQAVVPPTPPRPSVLPQAGMAGIAAPRVPAPTRPALLTAPSLPPFSMPPFAMAAPPVPIQPSFSIIDYSPPWCYAEGGEKMLVVISNAGDASKHLPAPLFCVFGSVRAACAEIAPGVLRCQIPAFPVEVGEKTVLMTVVSEDGMLVTPSYTFVYRAKEAPFGLDIDLPYLDFGGAPLAGTPIPADVAAAPVDAEFGLKMQPAPAPVVAPVPWDMGTSPIRAWRSLGADSDEDLDHTADASMMPAPGRTARPRSRSDSEEEDASQRHKIRLIDARAWFQMSLSERSGTSVDALHPTRFGEEFALLDDAALEGLSDPELQDVTEALVERVVRQLAEHASADLELSQEMTTLDDTGMSLMHYLCLYNFERLVGVLLSSGEDPNRTTPTGATPLHFAAAAGNAMIVNMLLKAGANPAAMDVHGQYPHDSAFESHHDEVGALLRSLVPTTPEGGSASLWGSLLARASSTEPPQEVSAADRQLLHVAMANLSLHEKCAISLAHREEGAAGSELLNAMGRTLEEASETSATSLTHAISLMNPDEKYRLEKEASVIQTSFKSWLLRRQYKNMREATLTLQAVTRGMLARKHFQVHRKQAAAALVIQRHYRSYLTGASRHRTDAAGAPALPTSGS